jgi:hypothetical protein
MAESAETLHPLPERVRPKVKRKSDSPGNWSQIVTAGSQVRVLPGELSEKEGVEKLPLFHF